MRWGRRWISHQETCTFASEKHKSWKDSWGSVNMQTPADWQLNDWHLEGEGKEEEEESEGGAEMDGLMGRKRS